MKTDDKNDKNSERWITCLVFTGIGIIAALFAQNNLLLYGMFALFTMSILLMLYYR